MATPQERTEMLYKTIRPKEGKWWTKTSKPQTMVQLKMWTFPVKHYNAVSSSHYVDLLV